MCNDFRLKAGLDYLIETFSQTRIPVRFTADRPNFPPRHDIRISDKSIIARSDGDEADFALLPWSWKGPTGKPVFNFRSEGRRFDHGRCLIFADGFYEFTGAKSPKTKWLFTMKDHDLFAIAGIIKNDAFTMLTAEPGPDVAPYHHRQVVTLPPDRWAGWLSHNENEAEILRPLPAGSLEVEQVS